MFVYFTDGTYINDFEIYDVKAKREQNKNNKKPIS